MTRYTDYISIQFQDGPVDEKMVNGCQIDEVLHVCRDFLADCQKRLPCRETALAITKVDEALHWLNARNQDRTNRGVEGTSEP